MLKRMPSVYRFLLLSMFICTGCSIKEDRSGCPCMLVLNLSETDEDRFRFLTVRAESSGGFLFQEIVYGAPFPDRFCIKVPRDDIRLNVFGEATMSGDEGAASLGEIRPDGSYLINERSECPPVYLFRQYVSADSDYIEVPVAVKKNYCRISISMLAERPYVFGLDIVGNICGYDVDGNPLPGDFIYSSEISDGKVCGVNVPRQTDTSLRLRIMESGGVVREFALGEYIAASGYDWNAEELEDISIVIDYVRTLITFKVRDWEKVFEFDVII